MGVLYESVKVRRQMDVSLKVSWLGLVLLLGMTFLATSSIAGALSMSADWKQEASVSTRFEIEGTGERCNPLRRQLTEPFFGDELFVRYRLRYDETTIDTPEDGGGEFFVLWLDQMEGNEGATHSGGVPNLGIHVSGQENRFMVRYAPQGQKFGAKVEGDQDYLLVGRLWKSKTGAENAFDHFDLWVNPKKDAGTKPHATAVSSRALKQVNWIGFSTGRKTEPEDRIQVWDVAVAETWEEILGLPTQPQPPLEPVVPEKTVSFAEHVFPILEAKCFQCHEGKDAKEGIRLDALDEVLNQTLPGDANSSRIYELVVSGEMPPKGKGKALDAEELATFRAWINQGLDWDHQLLPTPTPETAHWAFQPIRRPTVPKVKNQSWVRTPIDAFIARKHEELGLKSAPETSPETLARRISLDMLGLPPVEGEDINVVLENPAYGERWGRHWLDVVRWAESNGHQHNRDRPQAWRYRDYVVDAFNSDRPFDQFLLEQIAGDELEPKSAEAITATGFLSAARYSGNELDKAIQRNDILVDVTNTTAKAFLGLTMECAQCHSHKFDPITIRDYYRFQAYFANAQPGNIVFPNKEANALIEERWNIFGTVHDRLVDVRRKQGYPEPIYVIPRTVIANIKGEEKVRFQKLDAKLQKLPQSWSFAGKGWYAAPHTMRWPLPRNVEELENHKTHLLIRGDVKSRGPEVKAGWPSVFGPTSPDAGASRRALAKWMTRKDNPLTARVWVNRVWQWHFGRGLVETSGDFGTQGTNPTHPELLDYLATELIQSGWSTKHIHRLILNSATYRQSSDFSSKNAEIDPGNQTLWRWTPRRLEAEAVRDSVLAVSGLLDRAKGGPSASESSKRRSLYLKQRRDNLPAQQMLFDSASGNTICSRRRVSTTSLQPLWLLNSSFMQTSAANLAKQAGSVQEVFQRTLYRQPRTEEVLELEDLAKTHGLQSACLVLLNSSEFLYIP